jgi:hypothetical protein
MGSVNLTSLAARLAAPKAADCLRSRRQNPLIRLQSFFKTLVNPKNKKNKKMNMCTIY